jgi:acetate kinase
MTKTWHILTLNSGSSSIKFSLYEAGADECLRVMGEAERIGLADGLFWMKDPSGALLRNQRLTMADHDVALKILFDALQEHLQEGLDAAGHRVVHGGSRYSHPQWIDSGLLAELYDLMPLAPNHLPHEIKAILAIQNLYPELRQVACFDTAFHRHMPEIAQLLPLPRSFWDEGVRRYGFHGLSYEYVTQELAKVAKQEALRRVIIAHLGNGASMAAVLHGRGVETTMGFTPTAGLVMSTRSGDLDPGVVLYCFQEKGMDAAAVGDLLDDHSGLLGVSGTSSDMKELLDRRRQDPRAAQAVDLFCYQARKFIGALATVLGGVDTLVFTGGIGERAAAVRWNVCKNLAFLGIELDPARNEAHAPVISRGGSACTVRVMNTNEELVITRHTADLLRKGNVS